MIYYASFSFFLRVPRTSDIYTLSLHDALPIYVGRPDLVGPGDLEIPEQIRVYTMPLAGLGELRPGVDRVQTHQPHQSRDRKSTRLNSSHSQISYAVFCLKKKK